MGSMAQEKLDSISSLQQHPLEQYCIPEDFELPKIKHIDGNTLAKLLEVYMDNFIGLAQACSKEELVHFTHAVLCGIHTIFPPPGPTDDPKDEPISIKKLKQGDGNLANTEGNPGMAIQWHYKMYAAPNRKKVIRICKTLLKVARAKVVQLGKLEKLNGN